MSDRIHPVYKNLIRLRSNGQCWGHLPPNDEVFDFFERVGVLAKPKNILEFGFNLGFSASYQLQLFPDATLVSYDPQRWKIYAAIGQYNKEFIPPTENICASTLATFVWGEKFIFQRKKSMQVMDDYPTVGHFDYAFVDGDHTHQGLRTDIKNCVELGIPYIIVDNVKEIPVLQSVVDEFTNLKEVDRCQYYTYYPRDNSLRTDDMILLAL